MSLRSPADLAGVLAPWLPRLLAVDEVEGRVVVACSGGADSLALLALARARGLDVVAVYVDHGLRPAATAEARAVAAWAESFGATARAVPVDVRAGGNLEGRARAARYAALDAARRDVGADHVLVGHTRDDQAETVLLNLLRGSGIAGLSGMPAARGSIRRPLLGLRRSDTREICARLALAPVADPMNDDAAFRRVWLRRDVIPQLERGARRDIVEVLARQADVLRAEDALLDRLAAALLPAGMPVTEFTPTAAPPAGVGAALPPPLDAHRLASAERALARRAVRHWLPGAVGARDVDAVLDVAAGARRAVDLPGGLRVERAAGRLHALAAAAAAPVPGGIDWPVPGAAEFAGWSFDAWIEPAAPVAWPDGRAVAVVDAALVGARLSVVPAAAGSRFRPVGGRGEKVVFDALAEAGVPASERPNRPVVVDTEGRVVWVVGYRIDDQARVRYDTERYLWITAQPHSTRADRA